MRRRAPDRRGRITDLRLREKGRDGKRSRRARAGTAVTQTTVHRIISGDGVLFPRDQASIMPKIAAPVAKFHVNRGDHVKQGQLLAELENRDLTADVAEGQGAVLQAEANLRSTSAAAVPE